MATKKTPAPTTPSKAKTLQFVDDPGKTRDRLIAEFAAAGVAGNASTLIAFAAPTFGELSLTDCMLVLKDTATTVSSGDLSAAETMLTAQAFALNAIFGEMARRAGLNMAEYIDASERYMRLALKAQGQCRATLETLATIKNPPVVFARQANINNGGQQQVNNGTALPTVAGGESSTRASAHAGKSQSAPSKLLEASDVERLDTGAPSAAGAAHQNVEALAALDRPEDRGR